MPTYPPATSTPPSPTQFSLLRRSLLQSAERPLQSLISYQPIADLFAEEEISFGAENDAVYTPAITWWGLLS
jgi:hypothetical protein